MTESVEKGEGFSSIDFVCQCLIDEDKFNAFEKVLKSVINKDSNVLELGTGSGILAMLSARLGAKKVNAVEFDPYIAKVAEENIKNNKLDGVVKVVNNDARVVKFLNEKFDVVVMEMLATGLVDEMQVLAMNNLYNQGALTNETIVVPFAQENYIALANTNFSIYDFDMKMVRHLWSHDKNEDMFSEVTEKVLLNKVCFAQINDELFSGKIDFVLDKDVRINSVCLASKIVVDREGSIALEGTHSLNPIVIVPLPDRNVKAREVVSININYRFGGGFKNFEVKFI